MARIRKKNTKPELLLRRALWARGMRYRIHAALAGTPDLVFIGPKVVVMVDGCFWHGCPEHYRMPPRNQEYWKPKIARNRARDQKVDRTITGDGWTVMRFCEHEILDDLERVVEGIRQMVTSKIGH
jgi:DNA mismatch endonuclease, patch repair protein